MAITFGTIAGNWSDPTKWVGGVKPTAADDVIFQGDSANCAIDENAYCRSLDQTSGTGNYAALVTHNAAVTLYIGDGTPGPGNVALKLVAGGYTKVNTTTSNINFVSTSATQQTIDFAGANLANVNHDGAGGSWIYAGGFTINNAADLLLTRGALNFGNQTFTVGRFLPTGSQTRSLVTGTADITVTQNNGFNCTTVTGLTVTAGGETWHMTSAYNTVQLGGKTWGNFIFPTVTSVVLSYSGVLASLTATGSGVISLTNGGTIYITNASLNGTGAGTRLLIKNSTENAVSSLVISGTKSFQYCDFMDVTVQTTNARTITGAADNGAGKARFATTAAHGLVVNDLVYISGTTDYNGAKTVTAVSDTTHFETADNYVSSQAGSWKLDLSNITGLSGDCLGNVGLYLTPATTQTATGVSSFTWSTHGWTTHVPLPQDTIVVNNAFNASQTVNVNMPRPGKDISFNGCTGNPTVNFSVATTIFGSIDITGVTPSGANTITLAARSTTNTITSGGKTFTQGMIMLCYGATYLLADDYINTSDVGFSHKYGTYNDQNHNVSVKKFESNNGTTRTLIVGTGTYTFLNAGYAIPSWTVTSAGLTFAGAPNATFYLPVSAYKRTLALGGYSYGIIDYTVTGSAGDLDITGSNNYVDIKFYDNG